jgi:hypothetical protein
MPHIVSYQASARVEHRLEPSIDMRQRLSCMFCRLAASVDRVEHHLKSRVVSYRGSARVKSRLMCYVTSHRASVHFEHRLVSSSVACLSCITLSIVCCSEVYYQRSHQLSAHAWNTNSKLHPFAMTFPNLFISNVTHEHKRTPVAGENRHVILWPVSPQNHWHLLHLVATATSVT